MYSLDDGDFKALFCLSFLFISWNPPEISHCDCSRKRYRTASTSGLSHGDAGARGCLFGFVCKNQLADQTRMKGTTRYTQRELSARAAYLWVVEVWS